MLQPVTLERSAPPPLEAAAATETGALELFDLSSTPDGDGVRFAAKLGHPEAYRELWFHVSANAGIAHIDRADGFFPIALLVAMREGRPLRVRAPLSPKLFYHASTYLMPMIALIHRDHRIVPLSASELVAPPPARPGGVGCGFSCGIDSFALLDEHLFQPVAPGFAVTHLLFNDVGSHPPHKREAVFARRLARVTAVAVELGLPLVVTRSNQDEFLGTDFMAFDVVRNVTVPLLLQARLHRFYYAAAVTLEEFGVFPNNAVDMAEPALLPLLSSEALHAVPAGAQHSRIAKTRTLADLPLVQRHLDVCVNSPVHVVNCGVCQKCTRTLFTLEMLGKEAPFAHLFDIAAYRACRDQFIVEMLNRRSMLFSQVRDYARRTGYPIPPTLRFKAWIARTPLKRFLPTPLRSRLRVSLGLRPRRGKSAARP